MHYEVGHAFWKWNHDNAVFDAQMVLCISGMSDMPSLLLERMVVSFVLCVFKLSVWSSVINKINTPCI